MPSLGQRKQFCPKGHDTFINGRLSNHGCRVCTAERTTIWQANNPIKLRETRRFSKLKFYYGITKEDYDRLFDLQHGLCAICEKEESKSYRVLSVDHDHTTGQIRGLLCSSCNHGLGQFKDSTDLLEKAKNYLGRYHAS